MTLASNEGTERKTDRLEAFSDAVLAIAITLPVVSIHLKDVVGPGDLARSYAELGPELAAYALGATVIGLYWAHSHFSGKIVEKTDHGFNLLTILFLTLVSLTPIPAGPMVRHLFGDGDSAIAARVYTGALAAPSLVWLLRWLYARRLGLLDRRLTEAYFKRLTVKYAVTAGAQVAAAALAWADWRLGLVASLVVTLSYFVAPMTPEYREGQEPDHELEEAYDAVEGEA